MVPEQEIEHLSNTKNTSLAESFCYIQCVPIIDLPGHGRIGGH